MQKYRQNVKKKKETETRAERLANVRQIDKQKTDGKLGSKTNIEAFREVERKAERREKRQKRESVLKAESKTVRDGESR